MRARAEEHVRADALFSDPLAADWWSRVDWPTELDDWYGPDVQRNLACRADDIDHLVRRYTEGRSDLCVVELGCGLSTRQQRLSELALDRWVDVDLEPIVQLRESWGAGGDRHQHIGCSVLDYAWMDQLESPPSVIIAEGLLYYLPRTEVDALLAEMRARFAGAALILDVLGKNDFPKLLENTQKIGAPIEWGYEADYADVLEHFGLERVAGFEPERLSKDALSRYWHRFDAKLQGALFFGMNNPTLWASRSGTILGRLP